MKVERASAGAESCRPTRRTQTDSKRTINEPMHQRRIRGQPVSAHDAPAPLSLTQARTEPTLNKTPGVLRLPERDDEPGGEAVPHANTDSGRKQRRCAARRSEESEANRLAGLASLVP